ncbi:MAG: hypothetical protein IPK69_09915 [Phycisphaerales bacterium]|nr:MAG: hypothetical protein IPK69_09915 [Phycisphaerales bacterium]
MDAIAIGEGRRLICKADVNIEPIVLGEDWYGGTCPFNGYWYIGSSSRENPRTFQTNYTGRESRERSSSGMEICDGHRIIWTGSRRDMPTDSPIGQEVYYFDSPNTRFRGLVRRQVSCTYDGLEIVGLTEVANELIELLAEVHASPRVMLDAHLRRRVWKDKPIASPGLCGIVAGVLQRFTPWPYPFAMRTAAERQLNTHEVQDAVVRLFDRLMDAPPITRPPDYAGQFLALVAQRRAPLTTWQEELSGVWAFKIRLGYHDWIEGKIWMEPGVQDDRHAALTFHDHNRLSAGALRCVLW